MNYKKLYEGCIETPSLWFKNSIQNIEQFQLNNDLHSYNIATNQNLRLGKLVERFISFQLKQDKTVKIVAENYQVQNEKLTIGELDCLFLIEQKPIHLEIVYKFYLYDESAGCTEIEHWIGPNRNDSMIQKLDKLKKKQLPLLYNKFTKPLLNSLKLNVDSVEQKVCFKAQLFIPFNKKISYK